MKTEKKRSFDSVAFFRAIKEKLAARMAGMTLEQQKEFLAKVRKGEVKLT
jgi:hypothetical protein